MTYFGKDFSIFKIHPKLDIFNSMIAMSLFLLVKACSTLFPEGWKESGTSGVHQIIAHICLMRWGCQKIKLWSRFHVILLSRKFKLNHFLNLGIHYDSLFTSPKVNQNKTKLLSVQHVRKLPIIYVPEHAHPSDSVEIHPLLLLWLLSKSRIFHIFMQTKFWKSMLYRCHEKQRIRNWLPCNIPSQISCLNPRQSSVKCLLQIFQDSISAALPTDNSNSVFYWNP